MSLFIILYKPISVKYGRLRPHRWWCQDVGAGISCFISSSLVRSVSKVQCELKPNQIKWTVYSVAETSALVQRFRFDLWLGLKPGTYGESTGVSSSRVLWDLLTNPDPPDPFRTVFICWWPPPTILQASQNQPYWTPPSAGWSSSQSYHTQMKVKWRSDEGQTKVRMYHLPTQGLQMIPDDLQCFKAQCDVGLWVMGTYASTDSEAKHTASLKHGTELWHISKPKSTLRKMPEHLCQPPDGIRSKWGKRWGGEGVAKIQSVSLTTVE